MPGEAPVVEQSSRRGKQAAALRRLAADQRRFRFLDLCIRFGKIISKACPVGNLFSFGVCEGFNSGAKKLDTNSDFEDERVLSPSPAFGGAGFSSAARPPSAGREMKLIFMVSGE